MKVDKRTKKEKIKDHNKEDHVRYNRMKLEETEFQRVVTHMCDCGKNNTLKISLELRETEDKSTAKKINTAYWCFCTDTEKIFYSLDLKETFNIDFDW